VETPRAVPENVLGRRLTPVGSGDRIELCACVGPLED
jgi:hypothetical protein